MAYEISVIMSVYNETLEEIQQSIDSIKNQTYKEYELIIVVDAPDRKEIIDYLCSEMKKDNRIRVILNEKNIGLAMSMNKAASMANGKYLARMDADDICDITRFEKQLNCIRTYDYDLVCSSYRYIDECGKILDMVATRWDDKNLRCRLPIGSTIHHPTVMMKKEVFERAGGYRDFPCSQDYDLWLRFYDMGISMHYIDECLLFYRIRTNSISQSNKVKQLNTIWYIQELYRERKKCRKDTHTKERYEQYLKKNHVYDKKYCRKANVDKETKDKIDYLRGNRSKRIQRYLLMCDLFIKSPFYNKYYRKLFKNKLLMKLGKC